MRIMLVLLAAGALAAAESLSVAGSGTAAWLVRKLVAEGTRVQVSAGGSAEAVQALCDGTAQVVGLTRDLTAAERVAVAAARGRPLAELVLGRSAVALFVNRRNPAAGLSRAQLVAACAGRLTWGEVGVQGELADRRVQVVVNHPRSGSTRLLAEAVLDGQLPPSVDAEPVGSSVVQAAAVDAAVLAVAALHQDTPAVRALALDGVELDATSVADGRYALSRPVVLAWVVDEPLPAALAGLLGRLEHEDSARILADEGLVLGSPVRATAPPARSATAPR